MIDYSKILPTADYQPEDCIVCGAKHPDIAPITGSDAWIIVHHDTLYVVNVCPKCNR